MYLLTRITKTDDAMLTQQPKMINIFDGGVFTVSPVILDYFNLKDKVRHKIKTYSEIKMNVFESNFNYYFARFVNIKFYQFPSDFGN
jgi:PhoPQ-activated pathogenicity-related protein